MIRMARWQELARWARCRGLGILVAAMAATLLVMPRVAMAACLGDCNGNGVVSAGELTKIITIINLCGGAAAGCPTVPGTDKQCTNADKNGNGTISAGELTNVIFNIINFSNSGGCPVLPTPTVVLASPTPTASPTPAGPPLGQRTFSLGAGSGFFSSLLPTTKVGTPAGTLVLTAGPLDGQGRSSVTLVNGPVFVKTALPAGNITLCTRITSCTGTIYCNGGTNVDVHTELNSLAAGLTCVRDGTKNCPNTQTSVCCSNACEGVGVGSGNQIVRTSGVNPGTDSGAGAMFMTCLQQQVPLTGTAGNCTTADYSAAAFIDEYYATGTSTATVPNHCADPAGAPANKVPTFAKPGQNFSCTSWTTEGGVGKLAFSIPSEEGSSIIKGDGANAGVWSDQ